MSPETFKVYFEDINVIKQHYTPSESIRPFCYVESTEDRGAAPLISCVVQTTCLHPIKLFVILYPDTVRASLRLDRRLW